MGYTQQLGDVPEADRPLGDSDALLLAGEPAVLETLAKMKT